MMTKRKKIEIAIIDSNGKNNDNINNILENDKRVSIFGIYKLASHFFNDINKSYKPDICFINVELQDMSGLKCGEIIKNINSNIHLIFITSSTKIEIIQEVKRLNADYIENGSMIKTVINRIINRKFSYKNESTISMEATNELLVKSLVLAKSIQDVQFRMRLLTDNQLTIVKLKKQGKSFKEIGQMMNISPKTAHTHLSRAYKKLNIPDVLDYIFE